MESFPEYLKKQREEKKIRLSDIAAQTKISIKFLEAIESGEYHLLPDTYMRAFIKDYARTIGLDPDETMNRFTLHMAMTIAGSEQKELQPKESDGKESVEKKPLVFTKTQKIGAGVGGVVVLVVLSYLAFSPGKKSRDRITDYDKAEMFDQQKFDSAYEAATKVHADSSQLGLAATDTVWVNLVVDDGKTYDLLLKPGASLSFWGKKKFNMTIGNAGGLIVSLNGHRYPPFGQNGIVIRDLTIYKDGKIKK